METENNTKTWVEEEITLAEFAERFLHINDFNTPLVEDISHLGVEVLSYNPETKQAEYKPLTAFLVKHKTDQYWTDGVLKGTDEHKIMENGTEVYLKDHPDFYQVNSEMFVVDVTVGDTHTYYANGRLNHNTKYTPGGNALKFYATLRLRLLGKKLITVKENATGEDVAIGAEVSVRTDKNKLGPPQRRVDFQLDFSSGINEYSEWITYLTNLGYVARGGAWYTITEKFPLSQYHNKKFQRPNFDEILEDPDAYEAIRKVIIKGFIRNGDTNPVDVIEEKNPEITD